jgi:protocatechuate 3,4-dioxygenase alpha subunit
MPGLTPAQTIGPFFHEGLKWALAPAGAATGDAVRVGGRVLDRDGAGVSDALLEVWLPDWTAAGGPLPGLQRIATDHAGAFAFLLPRPREAQVHANVTVFARGLLRGVFTRVYLSAHDDPGSVRLPQAVPAARRATLIATRSGADYRWDVRLHGAAETVFFDL